MKIGISHHLPKNLPSLLNSLPNVTATFQEPFERYDVTVGFKRDSAREIIFEPEKENLAGSHYPVVVEYQKAEPSFRIDRAICEAPASLIRRWESIFNDIGRVLVFNNYKDVRECVHSSIPVEQITAPSQGVHVILESGYAAKLQLLTAIIRRQPFLVYDFKGVAEILRSLHCLSPWMLPFSNISDALTRLDLLRMSDPSEDLDRARHRCLSQKLPYNNLHIWLKVLQNE